MTSTPAQTVVAPEPKQAETPRESRPASTPVTRPFTIKVNASIPC